MPIEVLMPALSPTMKEGNLVKWVKKEGEKISPGEVLAEIETDKAVMEVEAVDEGKLARILVPEGTPNVKVNQVIALILEEGEEESLIGSYTPVDSVEPLAPQPEAPKILDSHVSGGNQAEETSMLPIVPALSSERILASPLAKRLAAQHAIPLNVLEGTGPRHRIIKADIEAYLARPSSSPMASGSAGTYQDKPLTSMRKVIAQRLTESKQQVPHFYLSVECRLEALTEARQTLNAFLEKEGIKISVNDMIIKACALSLQKVPDANVSWMGDKIRYFSSSDISVAVAVEGGLITPIVTGAHLKSLAHISVEMKDLAQKAREGKLKPHEFQGGSFSISNLGMYGVQKFSAIINPPQGAILAVGAGEQRPLVTKGQITVGTLMTCTLSIDHRVIDGAVAADFLKVFKMLIENPILMNS